MNSKILIVWRMYRNIGELFMKMVSGFKCNFVMFLDNIVLINFKVFVVFINCLMYKMKFFFYCVCNKIVYYILF